MSKKIGENKNKQNQDEKDLEKSNDENVDISDVSLEEIMKNPEKYKETMTDDQEQITWCPVCGEYTIHANGICTICGFSKNQKNTNDEEDEVSTSPTGDLYMVGDDEDLISELGYDKSDYDDNSDDS